MLRTSHSIICAALIMASLCISPVVTTAEPAKPEPKKSLQKKTTERSGSGAPIYRHAARKKPSAAPAHSTQHLEEIEAHVEKHIGEVGPVFHEIVSDLIHLDILLIPATKERPYHVLVTSGVSEKPMKVPVGMEQHDRVELIIALPKEWPLTQESFKSEDNYWPLRWLKHIGRLPHEYDTWIGWGHTIPNGDPAEPIANTMFTGVMLTPAYTLPADFFRLKTKNGSTIRFYALIPLYQEEMDFKLKKGAEALEDKLEKQNIDFIVDTGRRNVLRKRGWFK